MPIYKPTELRAFLDGLGIAPRKGLSQNFLIDGNIIRKIVAAAAVQPGDIVLEVGPGPGSLTQALLEAGAVVVAVEKDTTLAEALKRLQTPTEQLHIYCEDILNFDAEKVLRPLLKGQSKVKMIANLPYHLTTPILAKFAVQDDLFSSLTVMVQEEVGRRIVSHPNTPEYSSFTVFLQFYTDPIYSFTVKRSCFYPIPNVDSAVVHLSLHPPMLKGDASDFFKMTRTAFEHRRKMLRASLKELYGSEKVMAALESLSLNPLTRPENLSLDDFLHLFKILNSYQIK